MSRLKIIFAAVILGGLTACTASDIVISGLGPSGLPYDPSIVRYVVGQGDFPLELHGNPSNLDDDAFATLVESRLRIEPTFGKTTFRRDPQTKNRHPFRLVLVFNAANPRISARHVCEGEDLDNAGGPNSTLFVRGVFCDGQTVLSEDSALTNAPEDFTDERLQRLLDRLLEELLPGEGRRDINVSCPTANCR
ncbi:MAG: hypothetical protein O3C65_05595 [Proteobacteria bacterium]|nr:hypothetical protein [Pseudomonadota bacterium]MDA1058145.1 hypothetical protein [Pseudomonadota bacterium]